MSFDIREFTSNINQRGVSKQSHFDVFFGAPNIPAEAYGDLQDIFGMGRHLALRTETTELPGQSVATIEHRIYGPSRKVGYGTIYNDISFSMLCSHNLREKVFFDRWVEHIAGTGNVTENPFDVKYFNEYKSNVIINQYANDSSKRVIYSVELIDAFPTIVSALPVNHEGTEAHKLNVTMTFHRWKLNDAWKDEIFEVRRPGFGSFLGTFGPGILGVAAGVIGSHIDDERITQAFGALTSAPALARNISGIFN